MASTEKEFELEGHTLVTADLVAEAARLVDVARTHAMTLRPEGLDTKHFTELDQMRDMVTKEAARVEVKPPKLLTLSKEQEKVLARAYQWRANLVRRADRAFADDRHGRLKYHRQFLLFRVPDRVYEELFILVAHARQDQKTMGKAGVDEAFINAGEDILYELQNLPVPNRNALAEYEAKMALGAYGAPAKKPEPPAKLPQVPDNARALSILKGRLYLMLKNVSFAGQAAFCVFKDKEGDKAEGIRKDFILRIKPVEDDEDLLTLGRFSVDTGTKAATAPAPAAPGTSPAPAVPAPPPEENKVMPMSQVTSKPGGANPPPGDPLKKPPPRAVGLVRPSPTAGSKS